MVELAALTLGKEHTHIIRIVFWILPSMQTKAGKRHVEVLVVPEINKCNHDKSCQRLLKTIG